MSPDKVVELLNETIKETPPEKVVERSLYALAVQTIEELQSKLFASTREIPRLKEYEWMYKDLQR